MECSRPSLPTLITTQMQLWTWWEWTTILTWCFTQLSIIRESIFIRASLCSWLPMAISSLSIPTSFTPTWLLMKQPSALMVLCGVSVMTTTTGRATKISTSGISRLNHSATLSSVVFSSQLSMRYQWQWLVTAVMYSCQAWINYPLLLTLPSHQLPLRGLILRFWMPLDKLGWESRSPGSSTLPPLISVILKIAPLWILQTLRLTFILAAITKEPLWFYTELLIT